LVSPAGTTVTLSQRNGGSDNNAFYGIALDDFAPESVVNYPFDQNGTVPYLASQGLLSTFRGENPNGVWTLVVSDYFTDAGGVLDSWSMSIDCILLVLYHLESPLTPHITL
jgi:hypothetical protein